MRLSAFSLCGVDFGTGDGCVVGRGYVGGVGVGVWSGFGFGFYGWEWVLYDFWVGFWVVFGVGVEVGV